MTETTMLIALLAVLGVDLIVLVAFVAVVLSRKRWVRHQPGTFAGVIRVVDGEVAGLGPSWHRGYGRWIRDVLVWTRAPFLFRNELVPADALDGQRPARPGEVKRLGDDPCVVTFAAGTSRIQVGVRAADLARALTRFAGAEIDPTVQTPRPAGTVLTSPDD
jgi:hypothetical protein